MPTTSPRRRLQFGLVMGALVALSALAMPTAASAADACAPGTTATSQTQPWLDFANSPNQFETVESAYETLVTTLLPLVATVDADFTQPEFDALSLAVSAAFSTAGTTANGATAAFGDQVTALETALLAADPANQAANEAIITGFGDTLEASAYGPGLNTIFNTFLAELGGYLTAVQDAITANTPRPVAPASLTDAIDALATGVDGIGAFVQTVFYDGAEAQVVWAEVCLAATGGNDPTPLALGGGLLLLAGAGAAVVATKRRETVAA